MAFSRLGTTAPTHGFSLVDALLAVAVLLQTGQLDPGVVGCSRLDRERFSADGASGTRLGRKNRPLPHPNLTVIQAFQPALPLAAADPSP